MIDSSFSNNVQCADKQDFFKDELLNKRFCFMDIKDSERKATWWRRASLFGSSSLVATIRTGIGSRSLSLRSETTIGPHAT
jgi:hypothetical protein